MKETEVRIMRKTPCTLCLLFLGVFIFSVNGFLIAEVSINGAVETDVWVQLEEGEKLKNENTFSLKLEYGSDNYHLFAQPEIQLYGVPLIDDIEDLQNSDSLFDASVRLAEAYLDLYEFLFPVFDVRIGKQKIVWGAADMLNPTGNVSPSDFSDPKEFGEKIGVNALFLKAYLPSVRCDLVLVPVFTPSLLPKSGFLSSLFPEIPPIPGTSLGTQTENVSFPENRWSETTLLGAKLSSFILGYDVSASFYRGRYSIPVISQIDVKRSGSQTNITTFSGFPKLYVAGLDFMGSMWSRGIWGEFALFFPEDLEITTNTDIDGDGTFDIIDTTKIDPYVRFTLGTDYTCRNGVYYNLQWAHGFDYEIGKSHLNDYLVFRIEKGFFYDKLKILPLTLIVATGDIENFEEDYGVGYAPEIQFSPADNLELDIGCFFTTGKGENLLAKNRSKDFFFFTTTVHF
jgi:hypothetical protein